jgi:hypothetical protein
MYDIVAYGFGSVENSITNSSTVTQAQLDKSQPFTYYDFLKNTRGVNTAIDYNDGYLRYLQNWYEVQGETTEATQQLIANQYINLLRDINLNYTTNEEKRFLQNIDFNSKEDLQIVIPFYSRKLKEIIFHIRDQREEVKYVVDTNSIKGSNKSLEKAVFETIIHTILSEGTYASSLSSITGNMEIEIEEFVDTYSKYFNVLPEPDNEPDSRERFYSSNSNVIDGDLFINFDEKLKQNIFRNVFLTELGTNFTVNVDVTSLISCNPNDEFRQQINKQCAGGISLENKLNLQKLLIQKYIGTDYYYLSTNSVGDTLSGMLFKADNPTGHLLNIRNSSTQTIPSDQLTSLRQFGMYFTPDKTGILRFNTKSKEPYFDLKNVDVDTTYIFPDPSICGNVYYNDVSPVVYKITYNSDVSNISKTFTAGDPKINQQDQSYFGYYSKQQDTHVVPENRFDIDLVSLYNEGYIHEWRQDIYGNQYGLFKSKFGDHFRTFEDSNDIYIKDLLFNGGEFFDTIQGFGGSYDFTTFTGRFSSYSVDYYLTLRQFAPYTDFGASGSQTTYRFAEKDGGLFTFVNGSSVPDAISSDSPLLPTTITLGYYYRTLVEGGLNSTFTRPITGSNSLSATFVSSPNYILSGGQMYDGGFFDQDNTLKGGYEYGEGRYYFDDNISGVETTLSALTSTYGNSSHNIQSYKNQLAGRLFVGDYLTGVVYSLSAEKALYNTFKKYNQNVQDSVFSDDIIDFNVFYDCIQLLTSDYFVIDKIAYDSSGFGSPTTLNTYHSLSADQTYITNPLYVDGKVYYCKLELERLGTTQYVVPYLYSYTISDNQEVCVFPNRFTSFSSISANFTLTQTESADWFSKIITPRLTHNSRNMLFGLTFLAYGQNNIPYVFDYKIEGIDKKFKLVDQKVYTPTNTMVSYNNTLALSGVPSSILGSGVSVSGGSFKL